MRCPDCQNLLHSADCKGIAIHECSSCKGKWLHHMDLRQVREKADSALHWLDFDPVTDYSHFNQIPAEVKYCPVCGSALLAVRYQLSEVVIYKCVDCKAIWLPGGVLGRIIRYLEDLVNRRNAWSLAEATFKQFLSVFSSSKDAAVELRDLLAVFYIFEVRVGTEYPRLADAARRLYEFVPFI